jgi:uncharacterized protein (TIGR03437 family)
MFVVRRALVLLLTGLSCFAATLGTVVHLVGGAADIELDEPRQRLYLVNSSQHRIEVYSIQQRRFLNPIRTDSLPLSAVMSRDGSFLYVAAFDSSALSVIDLNTMQMVRSVSLPAKPEGVAAGSDGRILIATIGTGQNNLANILLVYDPAASDTRALSSVALTPPAPQSPLLPPPSGRIFLTPRSQLLATRDGNTIIGVNIPNASSRVVFVYEVASGTVLRSRTIANASSVLSASPDGTRFMAGLTLFDTGSLAVLGQQNTANAPYPFPTGTNFNTQQNQGGSVFSPDGAQLFTAFNIAPVQNPPARPNVSQLMINDPDNLMIRLGVQMPENLAGKMVISNDGGTIFALSDSGFTILPVSTLQQNPIAVPDATVSMLLNDQCGVFADQRISGVPVRNMGRGRMTVQANLLQLPPAGPAGLGGTGGPGGGAPGGQVVIVIPPAVPGGTTLPAPTLPGGIQTQQAPAIAQTAPVVRTRPTAEGVQMDLTFTSAAAARTPGTVSPTHTFVLQSDEAVNIPPAVRVFQNFRNAEAKGEIVPIPVGLSANEGLEDMVMDSGRQRLYIANSGLNRVEIFDIRSRQLLTPVKVGQLPRSLAMTPDGSTLYVANSASEYVSVIDLEKLQVTGRIKFPPLPFNSAAVPMYPSVIAAGSRGLQIIMNNGTIWKTVGNEAVPRPVSTVIGSSTIAAPRTMAATPNGEYILLLAGNGFVYLYDSLADEFIQGRQIFTNPIQGYYGPVAAGPRGQYYLANGTILNQSLTPVANAGTVVSPVPVRPGQTVPEVGRPVSAVAIGAGNTFVRFAQPARANANTVVTEPPSVEVVDANTGNIMRSATALEGPLSTLVGTARVNVNGRTIAVDASGSNAFALTTTGLSIVPLEPSIPADRPSINPNGTVSLSSYVPSFAPGSLITIFGRNLGASSALSTDTAPTLMGGVCLTLNNQPLPLLMTSNGQVNAQIPPETNPGRYPLVVRNVDRKAVSVAQTITVAKYAPAVFADAETKEALVFRYDGSRVTHRRPAKRDEPLMMFATGLGRTVGPRIAAGRAAPSDPLAETDPLKVYFGDPRYRQAEVIVDWSGLVPGFIGLYQINIRVPGEHMKGEQLPVTINMDGVTSQTTGPVVPVIAVQ